MPDKDETKKEDLEKKEQDLENKDDETKDQEGQESPGKKEGDDTEKPEEKEEKLEDVDVDALDEDQLEEHRQKLAGEKSDETGKESDTSEDDKTKKDDVNFEERYKEVQGVFTKSQQENIRLKEEKKILEKELKGKEFEGFERLSDEDKNEMREDDPDAYVRYLEKEKRYDTRQEEIQTLDFQEVQTGMANASYEFFGGLMNLDMNNEATREENQKKVEKQMSDPESAEFKVALKMDDHLERNVIPVKDVQFKDPEGNDQVMKQYSKEQLQMAYNHLFQNEIIKEAEQTARESAVESIESAVEGGSKLHKAPPSGKSSAAKKLEDYSQAEIDAMDDKQVDQLLKEVPA